MAPKPEHSPFASPWHFWQGDELPVPSCEPSAREKLLQSPGLQGSWEIIVYGMCEPRSTFEVHVGAKVCTKHAGGCSHHGDHEGAPSSYPNHIKPLMPQPLPTTTTKITGMLRSTHLHHHFCTNILDQQFAAEVAPAGLPRRCMKSLLTPFGRYSFAKPAEATPGI